MHHRKLFKFLTLFFVHCLLPGFSPWVDHFILLILGEGSLLAKVWRVGVVSIKVFVPLRWDCH
uniref:Uncharacterized protein n=1 Tax=Rhizophora mucronata TaxID=61149 RepID=A0A2P2INX6_RHIMU